MANKQKQKTKGQTMMHKTLRKKLKIEQHEVNKIMCVISGAPEG
jgi:hypothetical protein